MCKGEFIKPIPDKEAMAEMRENFGDGFKKEDCDNVCDDCYEKFMEWYKKEK